MSQIESGASTDKLTIDPTAKAARVTLYGPQGEPLAYPSLTGRGIASILIAHTTTPAAGTIVWSLREPTAGRTIYVTRIWITPSFVGTAAASFMRYELVKYTGATAYGSSPATITPAIKKTSIGAANAECRALETGFTLTGGTAGGAFYTLTFQRILAGASLQLTMGYITCPVHPLEFDPPIELAQNEALAIRVGPTNAAVVGDQLMGACEFQEST